MKHRFVFFCSSVFYIIELQLAGWGISINVPVVTHDFFGLFTLYKYFLMKMLVYLQKSASTISTKGDPPNNARLDQPFSHGKKVHAST